MKAQCHLPTGELQPLLILEGHWETISVDFIVKLPESGGANAIMVVVDSAVMHLHSAGHAKNTQINATEMQRPVLM
jgi:hypothetical protein